MTYAFPNLKAYYFCMEETWKHVSLYRQQGKYELEIIRTFGNREQPALSFVGGKNAGAYGECSADSIRGSVIYLIYIHFYKWHQALWYLILIILL